MMMHRLANFKFTICRVSSVVYLYSVSQDPVHYRYFENTCIF